MSNFVLALESIFPLAKAGHTLLAIRQTFISATMSSSKILLETFQKVVSNFRFPTSCRGVKKDLAFIITIYMSLGYHKIQKRLMNITGSSGLYI